MLCAVAIVIALVLGVRVCHSLLPHTDLTCSTVLFMCVVPQCCLCVWLEVRGEGERKRETEERKSHRERGIYKIYKQHTHTAIVNYILYDVLFADSFTAT